MKRLAILLLTIFPAVTQAHSVSLTCTASSTPTVTGYFFYRSTTNGSGYTKLNSTPVSSCAFTDTTVQANTTYFYVATAFDPGASSESAFSNQITAVIPPNPAPNPPTGLTLGTVAMHVSGSQTSLSASWQDAPKNGTQVWKVFDYNGHVIASGMISSNNTGGYSAAASLATPSRFPVTFQVCDQIACRDRNVSPS